MMSRKTQQKPSNVAISSSCALCSVYILNMKVHVLFFPECITSSLPHLDETLLTNVLAGVLSGALSSAIANPTDVLKV